MTMNEDGSEKNKLPTLHHPAFHRHGLQTGKKLFLIVFTSNKDGQYRIYIMNSNGSGLTKITDNALNDIMPVWFPDSKKIAFLQANDIYTMNYDGSNIIQITSAAGINSISVSPDGQKIAYESGNYIWVTNSDGTNPVNITLPYTTGTRPSWSPEGEKIVFATDSYPRKICIINTDVTDFKYLTNYTRDDDSPCFQYKPK